MAGIDEAAGLDPTVFTDELSVGHEEKDLIDNNSIFNLSSEAGLRAFYFEWEDRDVFGGGRESRLD